jgi:hypothetical protein
MDFIVDGIKLYICLNNGFLKVKAIEWDVEYSAEITDTKVLRPYATLPYHAISNRLKKSTVVNTLIKKEDILEKLSFIFGADAKLLLTVNFSNKASSVFVTFDVEHEDHPVSVILHCNSQHKVEDVRVKTVQIRHKALEHRNNLHYAKAREEYAKFKEEYENIKADYAKSVEEYNNNTLPDLVL